MPCVVPLSSLHGVNTTPVNVTASSLYRSNAAAIICMGSMQLCACLHKRFLSHKHQGQDKHLAHHWRHTNQAHAKLAAARLWSTYI